jgi:asparagine synthase (glutamine-hydrolysing)
VSLRFASTPEDLLEGSPLRLNRAKLAEFLLPLPDHEHEDETYHEGIFSLPCASVLVFEGGAIRKRQYWQPSIRLDLVPKDPVEAFRELRRLMVSAVSASLKGSKRPASLLSGGLDSSAVTSLAATCLRPEGRSVLAFSAIIPEASRARYRDEREYMAHVEPLQGVSLHYVTAEGKGPFDLINQPERFAQTFLRSSRDYLFHALYSAAHAMGADLMLEGNYGESALTSSWDGYPVELLLHFRLVALIRLLQSCSKTTGMSGMRYLAGRFKRWLLAGIRQPPLLFLSRDFPMQRRRSRVAARPIDHRVSQLNLVRLMMKRHSAPVIRYGPSLPLLRPLYTPEIVEFCLAASGELKFKDGYMRYLVRGSTEGLLPEAIRWRTTKAPFAPDYPIRYAAQLNQAKEFVAAVGRSDPVRSVVDMETLRLHLDTATPQSFQAMHTIPLTIYLICFLRQFPEFRS